MPKTIPFHIEVEEIATGAFMRKIHEMPGVVKMTCLLGHGGEGEGRKQLEEAATSQGRNGSTEQIVVKLLMQGPKHVNEISAAIGGAKSRTYSAVHALRKKGLVEATATKGVNQLTAIAWAQLGGAAPAPSSPTLALPAPDLKRGPKGRAAPGSGNIILRSLLNDGPLSPQDLRAKLGESGMSPKSASGVLDRARKHGIVTKNGKGYALTARGKNIEIGAATNG